MPASAPNIGAYLDRIGHARLSVPTEETLHSLHRAHMLAVPFENLDIGLGRKIVCDESAFLQKIVERRRGGFCYELNGAFAWLLRQLGFTVTLLSARVARADGSASPEFDHLTLRVDLEESWLADVGFGDSFLEPLRLKPELEQPQGNRGFRILQELDNLHLELADIPGKWKRQYSFTLQPRPLSEFAGMCHHHQTSPQSHFTQNRICSMATPDGRITLSGMNLIVTKRGKRQERLLKSEDEYQEALKDLFGIAL